MLKKSKNKKNYKFLKVVRSYFVVYSNFVSSSIGELFAAISLCICISLSIYSANLVQATMDGKMLLPPDSQSVEGIDIISETVRV